MHPLSQEAVSEARRALRRSRSLPQLSDSGVHDASCSGIHDDANGNGTSPASPKDLKQADLRQLLTLRQHYYPEGGWGWAILITATLAQCLAHGLHGCIGILMVEMMRKFGQEHQQRAGCNNNI